MASLVAIYASGVNLVFNSLFDYAGFTISHRAAIGHAHSNQLERHPAYERRQSKPALMHAVTACEPR